MKIFIDTEFTNFENTELISLGLVTETKESFYREMSYVDKSKCSDFVIHNILPLLEGGKSSVSAIQMKEDLIEWLNFFNEPIEIVGDYEGDWKLLVKLVGNDMPKHVSGFINVMNVLSHRFANLIKNKDLNSIALSKLASKIEDVFSDSITIWLEKNKKEAHHALDDAYANLYAYEECLSQVNEEFIKKIKKQSEEIKQ